MLFAGEAAARGAGELCAGKAIPMPNRTTPSAIYRCPCIEDRYQSELPSLQVSWHLLKVAVSNARISGVILRQFSFASLPLRALRTGMSRSAAFPLPLSGQPYMKNLEL